MSFLDFWKRKQEQDKTPSQTSLSPGEITPLPPSPPSLIGDGFFGEAVCTCFGVSADEIRLAIRQGDLQTIDEVTRACKAGGGCQSCHDDIMGMLTEWVRMKSRKS